MPTVAFLIPGSPNDAFCSQIAAFSAALAAGRWGRWTPQVSVCFGGEPDDEALARWRPWLADVAITSVPARVVARETHWYGQIDALYRWAPRDADVLVRMDADTLPVGDLEDVLDHVLATGEIAGVQAHYPFPRVAGRSAMDAWADIASGILERPLDFRLAYALVDPRTPEADRLAPFYVNDGAVFFRRSEFDAFAAHYLDIRPKLMPRLVDPYFSGQAALTLAVARMGAQACALPMRYNFPNDAIAAARYPEELQDARLVHYLRTDVVDRARVFSDAAAYEAFAGATLEGANEVLRLNVVRLLGASFPFGAAATDSSGAGAAGPVAKRDARAEVLASGLFTPAEYLRRYPDVARAGMDAVEHYLRFGERENRRPNPWFDPAYYRRHTMAASGRDGIALLDYARHGQAAGAWPCAAFDPVAWQRRRGLPDAAAARALFHFLRDAPGGAPALRAEVAAVGEDVQRFTGSGALEPLMRVKQGLDARLTAPEADAVLTAMDLIPDATHVARRRLVGLRDYARDYGAPHVELDPGGTPFRVRAPRTLGPGVPRDLQHRSRAMFVACIADATVRGRSALIDLAGAAVLDFEPWEASLFECELEIDPAIVRAADGHVDVLQPSVVDPVDTVDEAYSLLNPQSGAFGDWMYQLLPRYVAASRTGQLPPVPVLVDANLPPSILDSLRSVLPAGVEIRELAPFRALRVKRLWVSPSLHYAPAREVMDARYKFDYSTPDPASFLPTVREIRDRTRVQDAPAGAPPRLFLARRDDLWRRLLNQERVQAIARKAGFQILYPEELTFAEQVAAVRAATHVLLPEGSAVLLMYYARPGTRLCILNHTVMETTAYDGLLDGVDLIVLSGPLVDADPRFPHRGSYRIDEDALEALLAEWAP